jgi:hypothetical protein
VKLAPALRALGEVLTPEEEQWGDREPRSVSFLCPRLRSVYSPRASWPAPEGFGAAGGPSMPEWARVWDYGPTAEALGLSLARNSKRPPRYGLKGLPTGGRKMVSRALALLEDDRRLLSFWTVSLPTEALIALGRADRWPEFQDRVRKELARLLRRRGLPVRLVGVAELQPQRSRATGIPCPHLHVVFQGRRSPTAPWALSPADLDGVISEVCWERAAGEALSSGIPGQVHDEGRERYGAPRRRPVGGAATASVVVHLPAPAGLGSAARVPDRVSISPLGPPPPGPAAGAGADSGPHP